MDLETAIAQLIKWEDAYYNSTPLVSDVEYDEFRDDIVDKLRKSNPNHPYLDKIGAPVPDGGEWPKFTHPTPMGSLFKVNQQEAFKKWTRSRGDRFFLSEKADGCTITAYYEDGKLTTMATRGNSVVGSDITPNARYFNNVRMSLPGFTGVLRGEGIIYLDSFKEHFAPLGYANPRNAVSGKVQDSKNPELKRHITVLWHDVQSDDHEFDYWSDKFNFIQDELGLEVINHWPSQLWTQVWDVYEQYVDGVRASLNYWIDGMVVRVSNLADHDAHGITENKPKGSVAIKFPANGVETTLLSVEFNRGRSGRISIVGLIEPVQIDGTTVSRVSLHGKDWVDAKGLAIGDAVEVAKAGDIIPQIIRVIDRPDTRTPIEFPKNCPDCDTELVKNSAYIECQNRACAGEIAGALAKWIEKLDIKGIGPAIQQGLLEEIDDPADMYTGDVGLFARAANSEKVGRKIYKNVLASRDVSLAIFLSALHIDTLGSTNGQRIAGHFKTLDRVLEASEEDFRSIDGIDANASKIYAGLKRKDLLIRRLAALLDIEEVKTGSFTGSSFCITGKLSRKRGDVEAWIKERGGICKGSVSKDLTYLVTNTPTSGSSKNKKADQYGVKKVTEDELYELGGEVEKSSVKLTAQFKQRIGIFGDDEISSQEIEFVEAGPNKFQIPGLDKSVVELEGATEQVEGLYHVGDVEIDISNKKVRGSKEALEQVLQKVFFVFSD